MRTGHWTKLELPFPGSRTARGQEAAGGQVGWASGAPRRIGWGRKGAGGRKTERRRFCLLLWTRKHEPVFRGRSPERPGNKRRETMVGGGPTGRAGKGEERRGPLPARAEGAERGRNLLLNFLSRIRAVCARSRKHRKKRRKGTAGASHCPISSERCEAAGKSSLLRALAQAAWPEPATKGHSQSGLIRERSRCGALRDGRAHSGPPDNRALVGGGGVGGCLPEPLIPRQERASF